MSHRMIKQQKSSGCLENKFSLCKTFLTYFKFVITDMALVIHNQKYLCFACNMSTIWQFLAINVQRFTRLKMIEISQAITLYFHLWRLSLTSALRWLFYKMVFLLFKAILSWILSRVIIRTQLELEVTQMICCHLHLYIDHLTYHEFK